MIPNFVNPRITLAAWILCVPIFAQPLGAAADTNGIEGRELGELELAATQGKFVASGNLVGFDVQLHSQWETASGHVHGGGVAMEVDLLNSEAGAAPDVRVFMLGQLLGGDQQNGGSVLEATGTGIDNVAGVAQSIQAAGDGNRISNDTWVNVRISNSEEYRSTPSDLDKVLLQKAGSTTIVGVDGGTTTATLADNGLGLVIAVPGKGQVLQKLQGGSGLQQSAHIKSDYNVIKNVIALDVQWQAQNLGSISLPALQESLRGLPLN